MQTAIATMLQAAMPMQVIRSKDAHAGNPLKGISLKAKQLRSPALLLENSRCYIASLFFVPMLQVVY
jgi:hypothetical protein